MLTNRIIRFIKQIPNYCYIDLGCCVALFISRTVKTMYSKNYRQQRGGDSDDDVDGYDDIPKVF